MRWFLMLFTCPGRAALVLGCVSCCPCRNAASTEHGEQAAAKATAVTAAGVQKSLESLLGGALRCWWQAEGMGCSRSHSSGPQPEEELWEETGRHRATSRDGSVAGCLQSRALLPFAI